MHKASWLALALAAAPIVPASANVVTDWDEIAVKAIQPPGPVLPVPVDLVFRAVSMVHIAIFDAVDCVEPRYKPYNMQLEPSPDTSQDAAAASAAAYVLMKVVPNSNVDKALVDYLSKIPDSSAKDRGIKLGEAVAAKVVEGRSDDGSTTRNAYRPITQPGKYISTAYTVGWQAANMKPFVIDNPAQFRPGPPPDLTTRHLGERLQRNQRPW